MNDLVVLAASLQAGDLALLDYLDLLEERFQQVEPQVQAFLPEADRFARLRREANGLLRRYPQPESRPPLFGIPVGVKDIYHAGGFVTQAGSQLPAELLQGPEAAVVTALRQAGALIMGKTVTTEFAYLAPGPTRNPHNLDHTPGGSSSGSAAAVAAGLCPLALGSQTIGSLIRPASYCGVVGYKPSYDRVSREGIIPLAPSLDHAGFFTSSVRGMLRVAALVCDGWQTPVLPVEPVLGIPEGPYLERGGPGTVAWFRQVAAGLEAAGYTVRSVPLFADFDELETVHKMLMAAEAAAVHQAWFAAYDYLYRAETAELLTTGEMAPADLVSAARAGREELRAALHELMAVDGIDIWISPAATGPAPLGLESTGNSIMNLPWTYAGLPVVSVPAGEVDGLPLGLQLAGKWYEDEVLLVWAEAIAGLIRPA
jgi:Asp-tRNA(Asn)/Glu-tRNA(Gln) amidotransferase A subunit family amidase